MKSLLWLNNKNKEILGRIKFLALNEQGDDGGTKGVGFVGGIFIVIVVIGLIVAGINAALPGLITDIFKSVRDAVGL